ncbi:expressed hypothetical protein [Trichoplax adhaerens]|uniref:15-hydroxyprostaglandin dehydrogenase [NAD(+)] n=1 Tax=Trichoplax adhaerens TaxID=10228 RepID=B3RVY5_TRIAD|nr:expressed hypothetical protein [Trichoplax adhaerens]EDV25578.1 expressed hypothetical protein [Trichoplax adhaerens]|eukprot:XP_002111611.1 expressed hypothetical protein [Trichoplax adhaerens]
MTYDIKGKTAIVTGSARGIGKCICSDLLKKGANVVVSDTAEDVGNETTAEFQKEFGESRVVFIRCNVTKEEDLQNLYSKAIATFGYVDIVVNNAGILNEENWKLMMEINVTGLIRSCQLALDNMSTKNKGKGGVVVNLASVAGLMAGEGSKVYHASKHAVYGYTRSQYLTQGTDNVRFNCVCPFLVDTALAQDWDNSNRTFLTSDLIEKLKAHMLKTEDIAEAVIFLIEDESNAGKAYLVTPFQKWDYYEQPSVLPF